MKRIHILLRITVRRLIAPQSKQTATSNSWTIKLMGVILAITAIAASSFGQSFAPPVTYPVGDTPFATSLADFNGDTKLDLAVANNLGKNVSVLLGNGDGTFGTKTDYAVGGQPSLSSLTVADFNGDGKQDIATSNSLSNISNISVLFGVGDGTFQTRTDYALQDFAFPHTLAAADFNGDNRLDLIVGTQARATLLMNRGDGTFNSPVNYDVRQSSTAVAVGDFNQDGKLDFAITSYGNGSGVVSTFLGNGAGSFSSPIEYPTTFTPFTLASDDVNGDQKLDLITGDLQLSAIGVLLGNGDGTFRSVANYQSGPAGSLVLRDINGDAKIDIVTAHGGSSLNILLGNGDGSFRKPTTMLSGVGPRSVSVGELNNDGKPDLVVVHGANSAAVLLNQAGPHTIGGTITETSGTGVAGVTVTLTGAAPMVTMTGSDGGYSFSNLAEAGNFVVSPAKPSYTFIPSSQTFTYLSSSQTANFIASVSRFVVSGVAREGNGMPLRGVVVFLTGAISSSTVTAADGSYYFAGVPGSGNYVISAALPGYVISPQAVPINNLTSSRTVNFGGSPANSSFRLSGQVKNLTTGQALHGSYLSIGGGHSGIAFPSSDGNYSFFGLLPTETYTVSVSTFKPGAMFSNFLLSSPTSQTFSNPSSDLTANFFGMTLNYLPNSGASDATAGDFNDDGKLDLAAVANEVNVFIGKGPGTFENPVALPSGCWPNSLASLDLNRDGKLDLATANQCGTDGVSIFIGNGDGTFRPRANYAVSDMPRTMTVGDFNGDAIPDLITAGAGSRISVLLGIGDGTFGAATTFSNIEAFRLLSEDFNSDGKRDLIAMDTDANTVKVYRGNGNGTFQAPMTIMVPSSPVGSTVGDLNGDGKLDLVLVYPNLSTLNVLLGKGDGTFESPISVPAGLGNVRVRIADLNNDQKPDLAVTVPDVFSAGVLFGNGDGTFKPVITTHLDAGTPTNLTSGDFNGDRKVDLVCTISTFNGVSVLLNVLSDLSPVSISGQVKTSAGDPISGATISLGGSQVATTQTDSSGNYRLDNLAAGGMYSINVNKDFYAFSPQGKTFNNLTTDQISNFTGTVRNVGIVGRVTDINGAGLGGVTVALSGSRQGTALTNATGTYTFLDLPAGGSYIVTPSAASGSFNPANRTFNNLAFLSVADFRSSLSRTVQFDSASFTVNEEAKAALVTVNRSGDLSGAASVDYTTSDGTANQRRDYTTASGTLNFAAGETTKSFTVIVTDNSFVDGNRTVNLILSNPSGLTFDVLSTASLNIVDNDFGVPANNPIDDAQFFVRQHYYDFLNRLPDQGGLDYWTSQITGCNNDPVCINSRRVGVSAAYFVELEFQDTGGYVYRFYKSSHGQRPTYSQFMPDRSRVVAGVNLEAGKQAFAESWVQRAEFLTKYPASLTGPQFIDALLLTVQQGSGVDLTNQRQALIDDFNQNQSRARIVRLVADNATFKDAEYNRAFVLMQYFGYLRRDPDEGGYQFWLDVLNNRVPGNYRGMVCAFITSGEYQARFSSVRTRTDSVCGEIGP